MLRFLKIFVEASSQKAYLGLIQKKIAFENISLSCSFIRFWEENYSG